MAHLNTGQPFENFYPLSHLMVVRRPRRLFMRWVIAESCDEALNLSGKYFGYRWLASDQVGTCVAQIDLSPTGFQIDQGDYTLSGNEPITQRRHVGNIAVI